MMSKNVTLTKMCGPQLMANRNSHEYFAVLSQNSLSERGC